jgi:hypothetical protein
MKTLLEQTRTNLITIKDKMCYNDEGTPKCYKCHFGKFNDDYKPKWFCSLDAAIDALNYHLSFFTEEKQK